MAILIDMKMPKSCAECRFNSVVEEFRCMALPREEERAYMDANVIDETKPEECPLLDVPNIIGRSIEKAFAQAHECCGGCIG